MSSVSEIQFLLLHWVHKSGNLAQFGFVCYFNPLIFFRSSMRHSVVDCGKNQSVIYNRAYISYAYRIIKPGYIGTALTAAPYVVLARKAIPEGGFKAHENMSLSEWEKAMGFKRQ